jgi:hypothetical protein
MSGLVDAIFGGDDVQIPDTNPGMIESAEAARDVAKMQQETAKEYLDFSKQQYADLKPIAEKAYTAMTNLAEKQGAIADANEKRASEYADFERNTFRPLEQKLVDEANTYDTEAKREQLASRGMADVATAYQAQRQQALDTLARYGINPNSARFAAINATLSRAEAADSAGAANNARLQAEQLGYARKLDATSLGRGLASNATAAYGTAINANNASGAQTGAAQSAIAAPGAAMGNAYGQTSNMYGGATNSYSAAGNIYGNEFGTRMQGYNAQLQNSNQGAAALGNIAGRFAGSSAGSAAIASFLADGGKVHRGKGAVRGPGGPVDDKIPAMLSNGEYVLPADTVKAIGKKNLDKVIAKTHTPAAVQRRRQALKGA